MAELEFIPFNLQISEQEPYTLQCSFQSNSNKRTNLGTNELRSFRREWTLKFAQKHALHFFTSTGNACSLVVNIS